MQEDPEKKGYSPPPDKNPNQSMSLPKLPSLIPSANDNNVFQVQPPTNLITDQKKQSKRHKHHVLLDPLSSTNSKNFK